jgi:hypothetical protein
MSKDGRLIGRKEYKAQKEKGKNVHVSWTPMATTWKGFHGQQREQQTSKHT